MTRDFNVLATARGGHGDALFEAIAPLGAFRRTASPDVLVGVVPDRAAFLDQIKERLTHDLRLPACMGHVMPIGSTLSLGEGHPFTALKDGVLALCPAIGSRTYHIRVDAHGHRGSLHPYWLERWLGDVVWDELTRLGHSPRVSFTDADVVLQIEVLDGQAGITLVDRATAEDYPFLRVR